MTTTKITEKKEKTPVAEETIKEIKIKTIPSGRYIEAIGRRKTSTARVRLSASTKSTFIVNKKDSKVYFKTDELQKVINDAFNKTKLPTKFSVEVLVSGGGSHSQAEAVRHGISRILSGLSEEDLKHKLKALGFLKRDPRSKERRKFGLKKARKAPKWSKR